MNCMADGPPPGGPTDKLCGRHCHRLRPLRRTKRSDGRQRPRWKNGSHELVESTHANESRCDEIALEPNPQTEPLVEIPPLLGWNYEHEVSTRDRPARTGADAQSEESVAIGEVRLALRPYGRTNRLRSSSMSPYGGYGKSPQGAQARRSPVPRDPSVRRRECPTTTSSGKWINVVKNAPAAGSPPTKRARGRRRTRR